VTGRRSASSARPEKRVLQNVSPRVVELDRSAPADFRIPADSSGERAAPSMCGVARVELIDDLPFSARHLQFILKYARWPEETDDVGSG